VRVPLFELPSLDCRELIFDWLGTQQSRVVIERLMRVSGGNPLVLRSTLRRLRESHRVIDEEALTSLAPTDLDVELWRRTDDLSPVCVEMAITAAMLGSGERLETLATVCDLGEQLDDMLDEAVSHHILVADDEEFWFDHPQLRQLLYHSASPAERRRRHLEIGERLRVGGRAEVTAIAHHFLQARDLVSPEILREVSDPAADRAASIGAWNDAVRYSAAALDAAEALHASGEEIAALAYRAGRSAMLAREEDAATKYLTLAVETAQATGAFELWGRSLLRLARHARGFDDQLVAMQRGIRDLDVFLEVAREVDIALQAEVHALKAELLVDLRDVSSARREAQLAEDLADGIHDDEVQVKVAFAKGLLHFSAMEPELARPAFSAAYQRARHLADPNPAIWCLCREGMMSLAAGDLAHADDVLIAAIDAARSADNPGELTLAAGAAAVVAMFRGKFASAQQHAERALVAYRDVPVPYAPDSFFPARVLVGVLAGDPRSAYDAMNAWDEVNARRTRRYRPLVDALLGDVKAANETLDAASFRLFTAAVPPDPFITGAIGAQVELGALTERSLLIEGPLETLIDLYDRGCRFTLGWPVFVPRVIAIAHRSLGNLAEAEKWFDTAIDVAERCAAPHELTRTARDYADFLEKNDPADAARIAELRRIVGPLVGETVTPPVPRAGLPSTSAMRVVLVSDLVNSTQINDRLGDVRYLELLREHDAIIRAHLARYDGVEFKHTGDGIGAWFFSVDGALRCATEVQRDFAARPEGPHGEPWRVRTALAAGEPHVVGSDLFGLAVTIAFRVTDCADPGDVLVTADVAGLARGLPWKFDAQGSRTLKGVREPIALFVAAPSVA
jgi:class 3 adenylate cyclase/tetratricopeptide (TPR) repeat protein